jgi:hypothetical protein
VCYFSYHVGGARARSRNKAKETTLTHTLTPIQKISHTSHTHRVMITRVSTGGSRRAPCGERRMSRNEACAALEVLVASVVLASQGCNASRARTACWTWSTHCHHSHQINGSRTSRASRGASNRETGRSVFAHPKREAREDA